MTEKLTTWNDEQLRGLADHSDSLLVRDLAGEFLALRAERAKPTQSDEERARALAIAVLTDCAMRYIEGPQSQVDRAIDLGTRTVLPFFTSIRAEGSAEREKLEAAHPSWPIGTFVMKTKGSQWRGHIVGYYSTDLTPIGYCIESIMEPGSVQIYPQAAIALSQPAESGATVFDAHGEERSLSILFAGAKP